MNINDVTARKEYVGNGSTTIFAYDFGIVSTSDIEVIVGGVVQTLGTHYTVSGAGVDSGGNVIFVIAPSNAVNVILLRKQPFSQLSVYQANEDFPAKRLETDLSKEMMATQQIREILARVPTVSKASLLKNFIFPEGIIGKLLRWKTTTELENIDSTVFVPGSVTLPLSRTNGGTGVSTASISILDLTLGLALWGGQDQGVSALTVTAGIGQLPIALTTNIWTVAFNIQGLTSGSLYVGTEILIYWNAGAVIATHGSGFVLLGQSNHTFTTGDISRFLYIGGSTWVEVQRYPVAAIADIAKFWRGDGTWQDVTLRTTTGPTTLTIGAITDGQTLQRSGTAVIGITPIFTSEFVSSDQTVTVSSKLDVAHGLGAKPKMVMVTLKNATTEGGFSVGDEVPILGLEQGGTVGTTVSFDATNVSIMSQGTLRVLGKTGPATEINITPANWKYVVRAWK